MKKIVALLMILCMLLAFASCGATPVEKCQQKAVSIGEQFLDYKLTKEEAVERLRSLSVPETEGTGQFELSVDINALAFSISTGASYEQIQRKVDLMRNDTYN